MNYWVFETAPFLDKLKLVFSMLKAAKDPLQHIFFLFEKEDKIYVFVQSLDFICTFFVPVKDKRTEIEGEKLKVALDFRMVFNLLKVSSEANFKIKRESELYRIDTGSGEFPVDSYTRNISDFEIVSISSKVRNLKIKEAPTDVLKDIIKEFRPLTKLAFKSEDKRVLLNREGFLIGDFSTVSVKKRTSVFGIRMALDLKSYEFLLKCLNFTQAESIGVSDNVHPKWLFYSLKDIMFGFRKITFPLDEGLVEKTNPKKEFNILVNVDLDKFSEILKNMKQAVGAHAFVSLSVNSKGVVTMSSQTANNTPFYVSMEDQEVVSYNKDYDWSATFSCNTIELISKSFTTEKVGLILDKTDKIFFKSEDTIISV